MEGDVRTLFTWTTDCCSISSVCRKQQERRLKEVLKNGSGVGGKEGKGLVKGRGIRRQKHVWNNFPGLKTARGFGEVF